MPKFTTRLRSLSPGIWMPFVHEAQITLARKHSRAPASKMEVTRWRMTAVPEQQATMLYDSMFRMQVQKYRLPLPALSMNPVTTRWLSPVAQAGDMDTWRCWKMVHVCTVI